MDKSEPALLLSLKMEDEAMSQGMLGQAFGTDRQLGLLSPVSEACDGRTSSASVPPGCPWYCHCQPWFLTSPLLLWVWD